MNVPTFRNTVCSIFIGDVSRKNKWDEIARILLILRLSCHSVAVVLTLVQTEQIRVKYTYRKQYKNTVPTIQNTVNTSTPITKTATQLS